MHLATTALLQARPLPLWAFAGQHIPHKSCHRATCNWSSCTEYANGVVLNTLQRTAIVVVKRLWCAAQALA